MVVDMEADEVTDMVVVMVVDMEVDKVADEVAYLAYLEKGHFHNFAIFYSAIVRWAIVRFTFLSWSNRKIQQILSPGSSAHAGEAF